MFFGFTFEDGFDEVERKPIDIVIQSEFTKSDYGRTFFERKMKGIKIFGKVLVLELLQYLSVEWKRVIRVIKSLSRSAFVRNLIHESVDWLLAFVFDFIIVRVEDAV